ncbi:hypothetical protein BD626DRAFT_515098 [Schizophyllum amplum]|uniref:NEDD8-activating enzyme E1 regulatory subunit n=1 Tax=Schizophyllum amplum TaxID=97359 RepID=A0A550BXZ2_9AGAR|nr:hypothetical protein BD626DRAFT_515098 [Auriculariopsis ampla]
MQDSKELPQATTALVVDGQPDSKTRRYDRQLRLWAATGQTALEESRILVISGTATCTSILKNLVLPGIGHFTILDAAKVTPEDAGNNFFLEAQSSIGKSRAEEAVRLLGELNDGVDGKANTASLDDILEKDTAYLTSFTVVIAHNLPAKQLSRLSTILWEAESAPTLAIVRSAGFVADFYLQYREHAIIESHSETMPSLRISKPFPSLLEYAESLDFEKMDSTDHAHIPFVVILVRAMEDWKNTKTFKESVLAMKKKFDEENFDEAEGQAYRCWSETSVPSDITALFQAPQLSSISASSPPFFLLLDALKKFLAQPPHVLPLSATLPDMKASTGTYIHLQKLYKARAEEEKEIFKSLLAHPVPDEMVDTFVKNAHGIKLLSGKKWTDVDANGTALAKAITETDGKEVATHLALSALSNLLAKEADAKVTEEALTEEAKALLPLGTTLPEAFEAAAGEVARSPTADLPNTAAFLGGIVAQEVIKMITKQYTPINGVCVWTSLRPGRGCFR